MMDIFLTHGSPEVILTDRGREFWNHVNMSLFDRCGVKHRMTSAYHPQTNGLDERTNQTLKRAIGKTLEGSQERWEDNLKEVLFAHNSSKQASSKFSPFRLMYGREPRLFSEIASDTPEAEVVASVDEDDVSAFMSSRAEKDAAVFDQVRDNIQKAQERQKSSYRKKSKKGVKRFTITPGMVVLKRNERKRGRPGMTMLPDWSSTEYRVISVDNNLVQLETMDGQPLSTKTPYASVKPLRGQTDMSTDRAVGMTSADSSDVVDNTLQVTGIATTSLSAQAETGESSDSPISKVEQDTQEDAEVVIVGVQSGRPLPALRRDERMSDFGALLSSPHTWLNDETMDHAQALLKAQFPSTEGLYATTSVALLSTVPGPTQGFVQIFNLSANHWVTVSNIGCKDGR
ncbi:uncharacterized protein LOC134463893 isoform X2 [Engraulis encrasicolus]|uniref:uncharacterized protein LOC134463893 isoform X2 n=2 Tax=Engraulis encrasicolus TaxID=184585 RepID=UPI002FD7173B